MSALARMRSHASSPPSSSRSGTPLALEVGDARIAEEDDDEIAARNARARLSRVRHEKAGRSKSEIGSRRQSSLELGTHAEGSSDEVCRRQGG